MIVADHLSRSFGAVEAVKDLQLDILSGQVTAVMGGNGAGKSTFLRMLSGALRPTRGAVRLKEGGRPLRSIADARAAGVWMSDQEGALIPAWSVGDHFNLLAGIGDREPWTDLAPGVAASMRVERLSQHDRQLVEIGLACAGGRTAVLLDEPTAGQGREEKALIHTALRNAAARSASVVWVTHDLNAVKNVADRIVVLRDGCLVCDGPAASLTREALVRHLVREAASVSTAPSATAALPGRRLLEFVGGDGRTIQIRQGEIVGLAGNVRSGCGDLLRSAVGLSRRWHGPHLRAPEASARAMSFMSRERDSEWDFAGQSLRFCLTAAAWPGLARNGWIDRHAERALAEDLRQRFSVVASSIDVPIGTLSGGNRQKALLARLASTRPEVLLLDEPFSGIDAPARADLRLELRRLAGDAAILIHSQEWDDMIEATDRVLVAREDGEVVDLRGLDRTVQNIERALLDLEPRTAAGGGA